MAKPTRRRFWIEASCAGIAWLLALVTLTRRDWIEAVFGVDPDHGSGALEWILVAGFATVGIVASVLTIRERRVGQRRLEASQ
jgi:hypothetical protein